MSSSHGSDYTEEQQGMKKNKKNQIVFPKRVKVGPFKYKICWNAEKLESEHTIGECGVTNHIIVVDPDHPLPTLQETLLHEIVHACLGTFRIQFHTDWDEIDEQISSLLGVMLFGVLQDNPKVVKFLTEKS